MTAREALSLLFRHRMALITCFYVPILIGIFLYFIGTPSYLATAKVLISSFQEGSSQGDLDQSDNSNSTPLATKQEVINSELEIIGSTELADFVIQHFGVQYLFPRAHFLRSDGSIDHDGARTAFGSALSSEVVKNSNVILIHYEAPTPDQARLVLNWILNAYQQQHNAAFTVPVATFLDSQLAAMDQRIEDLDNEEATYKTGHKLFDATQQRQELLQAMNDLRNSASELRAHSAEMQSRIASLQQVALTTPQTVQSYTDSEQSDAVTHAQSQLLDLEVQEKQLETRYTDSSVPLQTVRGQIAAIEGFLDQQGKKFSGSIRTSRNPLYDEIAAEIVRDKVQLLPDAAKATVLNKEIDDFTRQLTDLEQAQIYIGALERARTSTAEALHTYRQRQVQAQLQEQFTSQQATSIRVIQSATSANHRFKPRLSHYLLISAGLGFVVSLVFAATIFASRNTFIVPESLERTFKIPVIASLPERQPAGISQLWGQS